MVKDPTERTEVTLRLPFDPFALWREEQHAATDRSRRLDDAVDLAVWPELAPNYDGPDTQTKRAPDLLRRVLELVPPGTSVLDIGAGTGNYAIPLARRACTVTALEYSPDMLAVLTRKLTQQGVVGVAPLPGKWEDTPLAPHDYVLAANCLYRTTDLRYALKRFSALATARVLIIFGVGMPHVLLHTLSEALAKGPFYTGASPDHIVWGLQSLGVLPWVEPFSVKRTLQFANLAESARLLGRPLGLSAAEQVRAMDVLAALLQPVADGWEYAHAATIALIHWQAADLLAHD